MAAQTVHGCRLDPEMGLAEGAALQVVAFTAQCRQWLRKKGTLRGGMRLVTTAAVFGGWRVHLFAGRLFLHILMAGKAEIRFFREQELGHFCFMRTVALGAITGYNRFVFTLAGFQRRCQIAMAVEAQIDFAVVQHAGDIAAMGVMARQAHPTFKGFVIGTSGLQFHEIVVAFCAEGGALDLQQFFLIAAVGIMACRAGAVSHRFMRLGLEEARLGIGMAGVTHCVHTVLKNILEFRTVNIMAGRA